LNRAFELKKKPENADGVVASLTFDNFIQAHRPEAERWSPGLIVDEFAILDNMDSNLSWILQEDVLRGMGNVDGE
jgi:hypothetical protein